MRFGKRVLDVGCAYGRIAQRLKTRGCTVVGVELDAIAANAAREHCETVILGSVEDLDVREAIARGAPYDVVLAADVIEHLADGAEVVGWFRSVMAPGSELIISVPNVAFVGMRLRLLSGDFSYRPSGVLCESHLHFYTFTTVHSLVSAAGYRQVRIVGTPPVFGGRRLGDVTGVMQHVFDMLASAMPRLFGYQLLVRATCP